MSSDDENDINQREQSSRKKTTRKKGANSNEKQNQQTMAKMVRDEVNKWKREHGDKLMDDMKKEIDKLKGAMVEDTFGKRLKEEIKQEMRDEMQNVALQRKMGAEDMVKLQEKRGGFHSHDQLRKEKDRIINMAEV